MAKRIIGFSSQDDTCWDPARGIGGHSEKSVDLELSRFGPELCLLQVMSRSGN